MAKDYYSILGVDRNATEDDIKKAYKKLAMKWHPDRFVNSSDAEKKEAEEKFKEINEANTVLSDSQKRRNYDQFGSSDGPSMNDMGADFADFMGGFSDFFSSGRRQRMEKGRDVQINVTITLKEAYEGVTKDVHYQRYVKCKHCNGTGSEDGVVETCPHCNGTGQIHKRMNIMGGFADQITPCPHCGGKGKTIKKKCKHCNGSGLELETATFTLTFPRGIFSGAVMPVQGAGSETQGNGINGDLIIRFNVVADNDFMRDGNDLIATLNVNLLDAWEGCEKTVNCIDGRKFKVTLPQLTPNSYEKRFSKEGFLDITNQFGIVGDFVVRVEYETPKKKLTKDQKELLEKFYEIEKTK